MIVRTENVAIQNILRTFGERKKVNKYFRSYKVQIKTLNDMHSSAVKRFRNFFSNSKQLTSQLGTVAKKHLQIKFRVYRPVF